MGYLADTNPEPYDLGAIGADDQCLLGQWLQREAHNYSDVPEYEHLLSEHSAFHIWAAGALRMVESGHPEAAFHMVHSGGFHEASMRTISAIRTLRQQVDSERGLSIVSIPGLTRPFPPNTRLTKESA